MSLNTPEDAMPWVGLYVCVASLVCTLAMAADAFQGFLQGKLWFPCRYFTLNAASITVIAIAMKLPVDLTTIKPMSPDLNVKAASIYFLITMLANFLPSLALMNDKELLFNIIAFGILIITIFVNVCIEIATKVIYVDGEVMFFLLPLISTFSVALAVPAYKRILELQYNEQHELDSNYQGMNFSFKKLVHHVKKYWMMAETGNSQFVIACSQVSSALGVISLLIALRSCDILVFQFCSPSYFPYGHSDYKWSIKVIIVVQLTGVLVGSIAPTFRCLTSISYFNLSKRWRVNLLNTIRVEGQWTQRLQQWKQTPMHSHIPGRQCKIVFHIFKNITLNFIISLQILVVIICKIICVIPQSFMILFFFCWYFCKSLLKSFTKVSDATNSDVMFEMKEYATYVLQVEDEAKISERILRTTLKYITRLLSESEKKMPRNLLHLLQKSTSFNGVLEFDNDEVPPLHSEETQNSWSLVAVTFTTIVAALPNVAHYDVKGLFSSMREGLQFVKHIEEILYTNGDLVKSREAARRVWTDIEVYRKWLHIDLQKKTNKQKTSKGILQWLSDEAEKAVIQFKICKTRSLDDSLHKFIASSSMYRISQTILLHCNKQENWSNDEEIFEWISTIIADIFCACFTNLPRVISMKCHHDTKEKREDSIRTATRLLGKSKKILKILKSRKMPNLDVASMAYIDRWHALPKSEIPNATSLNMIHRASSSSCESLLVTTV